MPDAEKMLADPHFQRLLARRSRLRWGFSGILIGAYLSWGILGVYFADAYAAPFFGNTLPTGGPAERPFQPVAKADDGVVAPTDCIVRPTAGDTLPAMSRVGLYRRS